MCMAQVLQFVAVAMFATLYELERKMISERTKVWLEQKLPINMTAGGGRSLRRTSNG